MFLQPPARSGGERVAMSQKPKFVKNALLDLEKFSMCERSGWRPRSEKRIN